MGIKLSNAWITFLQSIGLAPAGGTTGQVLKKDSATDYDYSWADESGGGSGGFSSVVSKVYADSPFTTQASELVSFNATGGNSVVNLPTAVGADGKEIAIFKTDSSGNIVTINADGSETINGSASYALGIQYESVRLISDGANWLIIG